MISWAVVVSLVLATVAPLSAADGLTRLSLNSIAVARMDPIMQEGQVAGHAHTIFGASNFRNVLNTPEEQQRAHCTSANSSPDKSSYWVPQLYFINPNGTYTLLKHDQLVYYSWSGKQKVQPFPKGMRMVSGIANKRAPGEIRMQGLSIAFWHFGPDPTNPWYFPNGTHLDHAPDDQIVTGIYFPRCGLADGSLDSDNHFDHMTWPVSGENEWAPLGDQCPDTHPVMYPGIFMETFWKLEPYMKEVWNKTGPNVILANGDTTGITYHADFVSGWDEDVLRETISECGSNTNPDLDGCPPLQKYKNDPLICRLEGQIPAEDVGLYKALTELPGCNPRWDWDGPQDHPCGSSPQPGFVSASRSRVDGGKGMLPVAIPGLGSDEARQELNIPYLGNWTTLANQTADSNQMGPVMSGSQDDVNAASEGGAAVAQVDGQEDSSAYNNRENPSPPPATATEGSHDWHVTRDVQCRPNMPWEGFPCSEVDAPNQDPAPAGANILLQDTVNRPQSCSRRRRRAPM